MANDDETNDARMNTQATKFCIALPISFCDGGTGLVLGNLLTEPIRTFFFFRSPTIPI